MHTISSCASFLLFTLFFHSCLHYLPVLATKREAIEIIIGGGGGGYPPPENEDCPPPPPPEPSCPPPASPPHSSPPPLPRSPKPPLSRPPARPSPSPPTPLVLSSARLDIAYRVIQNFKPKIIHDPMGITSTWKKNRSVCKYKGFRCDTVPGYNLKGVSGVDFNGYGFAGGPGSKLELTGFMDELPDIAFFHANSNNFTGSLPKILGRKKLPFIYEIDLSNNKLSGQFPAEVLTANLLTFLDLRFNSFTGVVPAQVFNLDVDVLFINNNNFTGNIPENLGSTTTLYLTFANNKFTGQIPKSIGKAPYLLEAVFLNNQLSGCLPYEIGLLRNTTLFDVGTNQLTGPIPHSFGCLAKMEILVLAQNKFFGTVPEMVCKLPNLSNFSLSFNYFTQVGPECRKLIQRKRLDVRKNCIFDLPDQRTKEECANFFSKPMYCPNANSLNYIPCTNSYYKPPETFDSKSMAAAPSPWT